MGTSVVTGVDVAPILEHCEHILDLLPLTIKGLVVGDRDFAVRMMMSLADDELNESSATIWFNEMLSYAES